MQMFRPITSDNRGLTILYLCWISCWRWCIWCYCTGN